MFEASDDGQDEIDAILIRLDEIEARLDYLEGSTIVTAIDHTTEGNQTVICTASLTVTLALDPLDRDLVVIKATNGNVTINGNGNNIDGDNTVIIRRNFTGLDMQYSLEADAWFIV